MKRWTHDETVGLLFCKSVGMDWVGTAKQINREHRTNRSARSCQSKYEIFKRSEEEREMRNDPQMSVNRVVARKFTLKDNRIKELEAENEGLREQLAKAEQHIKLHCSNLAITVLRGN